MSLGMILLILLIILLIGSIPVYPYSRGWGLAPVGGVGTLLLIVILLIVTGVIPISIDGNGRTINVDLPNVNLVDENG